MQVWVIIQEAVTCSLGRACLKKDKEEMMTKAALRGLMVLLIMALMVTFTEAAEKKVTKGKKVSIEYTLKLEDGTVMDTNVGGKPFTFIQGSHQIIPGLEKAIEGMKVGEKKHVVLQPKDAYGEVDKNAFVEVPKDKVPKDIKVGTYLQGTDPQGGKILVRVAEIKKDTVVLDFNHPLAGKTLFFDVKILDIQDVKLPDQRSGLH